MMKKALSPAVMQSNFGLSKEEFDELVVELQKGDEQLFEQIFLSHFELCMNYIQNHCKASYDDAYEAVMETLVQFRKRLIQGKVHYGNMKYLFTLMAKQNYLKMGKVLDESVTMRSDEATFDEETFGLLDRAWSELCDNCQKVLKGYYYDGFTLKQLTQHLNHTSNAATRKQKERCLKKLKTSFLKIYK